MKNKTLKNLIALGAFAILVLGANYASAAFDTIPWGYNVGYSYPTYDRGYTGVGGSNQYYNYTEQQYSYTAQPQMQNNYAMQQPYTYVQAQPQTQIKYVEVPTVKYVEVPTVKYVTAPSTTTTKTEYVQVPQQQVQYVNSGSNVSNTQGASVLGASALTSSYGKNTGVSGNTGQFVNYDANSRSAMLASAYGTYNAQPVAYDTNGVTALSVKGSGSFMPSSVFQWFLMILLILAIIIIARMVSKTFSKDPHATPAH